MQYVNIKQQTNKVIKKHVNIILTLNIKDINFSLG